MMKDGNTGPAGPLKSLDIDQELVREGTAQLACEIKVLEGWLAELEAADAGDPETAAARKSYRDMLRSRREMLSTLSGQGKA